MKYQIVINMEHILDKLVGYIEGTKGVSPGKILPLLEICEGINESPTRVKFGLGMLVSHHIVRCKGNDCWLVVRCTVPNPEIQYLKYRYH